MMTKKVAMYDPPAGWLHGFPKPFHPLEGESLEQTLIRDGYPEHMAKDVRGVRFWEETVIEKD